MRVLPRSLFGRTLLIVLIPLVLVQAVALQIFYGSHLDIVSRRLSSGVAGEIATTIELLRRLPDADDQAWALQNAWDEYELRMRLEPDATLPEGRRATLFLPVNAGLAAALGEKLPYPFSIDWATEPEAVLIHVQLPHAVLQVEAPRKR